MTVENHPRRITNRLTIPHVSNPHGGVGRCDCRRVDTDPVVVNSRRRLTRRAALGHLAAGTAAVVGTLRQDSVRAQATPTSRGEAPNHVVLTGAETKITYEALAAGRTQLTYVGPYGRYSLAGEQLQSEVCALGRLLTGSLGAFPDQGELWLTLILPRFNPMTSGEAPVPVATAAVLKWVISTIAGPPRSGALEEYRVVALEGTAQII